jgi:hypothetical protein
MKIEWKDFETHLTLKQIIIIQVITMMFFCATMDCILRGHVSYIDQQRMKREENYRRELKFLADGWMKTLKDLPKRVDLLSDVLEYGGRR